MTKLKNPKSFTDIENHWAKDNIDFVTEREIFLGTDTNIFNPNISMTRAIGGEFAPKATATRAEVSAVIERFVNEVLK